MNAIDLARRAAPVYVSAHAVRRYFERVKRFALPFDDGDDNAVMWWLRAAGADVDGVRAEITRIVSPAVASGATSVKSGNMRFVMKGRVVATIVPTARRVA